MVKQNLFKKIIIIIAFITISISSFLVSVSLADEPCEDKPTTGKYSCYDMANKLGLCELKAASISEISCKWAFAAFQDRITKYVFIHFFKYRLLTLKEFHFKC